MFFLAITRFIIYRIVMHKIKYKEAKSYYDSFMWKKATYANFILRIKKNIPFEVAILPWVLSDSRDKLKEKWKKYRENCPYYDFYNSYDWIKISYRNFLTKIRSWFTPEVAIIKNSRRNIPKRDRNRLWNIRRSSNRNKKIINSYYFIDVTYDKETAKIFRDIYIDKIRFCDLKLLEVEDQKEVFKILKEKDFLIKQLSVFNKWNPL